MKKQLSNIQRGKTFDLGGTEFIVLKHDAVTSDDPGHTFVEATKDIFDAAFDEDNNNDWRTSSLRSKLGEWLDSLCDRVDGLAEAVTSFTRDLTTDDGLHDYGTCEDTVSLLTADEYREHRDLHPTPGRWRWLLTPDGTEASSGTSFVRRVSADGSLSGGSAYGGSYGVRPALYLKSDLLVSVDGEDEQDEAQTPEQKEMALYEKALEAFGERSQILMAIEEMSELARALLKYVRYKDWGQGTKEDVLKAIAEERADVSIMLNQLEVIFGDNSEEECAKLEHLAELLGWA
ncbi:DUF6273 domain-containing protein [Faecalispora jeddahensis]|uniref:DUF6273 domain-containing protein n=1 Tax=Faecalispora jeddahensis TaxID=1414721 RepID=UPI0027BB0D93|nr:DUF6273 domain-containing protein [Faecalispora jeddahensis]